ncbi:MAG: ribonuclease G, partial [Polyangiales bacterium]
MAKNTLVINCDIGETRVALIENGILAELHLERRQQKGIVGNIYLGRVSRVLPGMQAAFIDIGEERAAFLHVEDLIRPADFDAYLAGSKQREGERRERLRDRPEESLGDAAALEGPEDSEVIDISADAVSLPPSAPAESIDEVDEIDDVEEIEGLEPRDEDDVVRMDAPKDIVDMATRRGRRRSGGRSGAKREDITADAQADGEFAPLPDAGAVAGAEDDEDLVAPVAAAPVAATASGEPEVAKTRPSRAPRARRTTPPPAPEGASNAAATNAEGGEGSVPAIDPLSG